MSIYRTSILLLVLAEMTLISGSINKHTAVFHPFPKTYFKDDVPHVDFCKLISQPGKYHNQIIRTEAIYVVTLDDTFLYSLECLGNKHVIDAHLDCSINNNCEELKGRLKRSLSVGDPFGNGSRVKLTVVGRFTAPQNSECPNSEFIGRVATLNIKDIELTTPVPIDAPFPQK